MSKLRTSEYALQKNSMLHSGGEGVGLFDAEGCLGSWNKIIDNLDRKNLKSERLMYYNSAKRHPIEALQYHA